MLWLALACNQGKSSFLMDELRILAIQSDPAEIIVSNDSTINTSEVSINLLTTDPLTQGGNIMLWTCFDIGEGCLEASIFENSPASWFQLQPLRQGTVNFSISVPQALGEVLGTLPPDFLPFTLANIWAFTCAPGVCPSLEDAQNGTYDIEALSQPFQLMETLPMEGTSLAYRSLILNTAVSEERVFNPTLQFLESETGPRSVAAGETLYLQFAYERFPNATTEDDDTESDDKENEGALFYPFATVGEINREESDSLYTEEISGSLQVAIDIPPETPAGNHHFFLSLENFNGGNDLWEGTFTVE
ncbi:MAG: hypothetical protein VX278_17480 [Myxococcota bacterium]|nr:hypothetical protein [Myxococcota bacterium]